MHRFVAELRAQRVPVSPVEVLDAFAALGATDMADREGVRVALQSTLVKRRHHLETFDAVFDVFFGLAPAPSIVGAPIPANGPGESGQLADLIWSAIAVGDLDTLRRLAQTAVELFAGMEPGRPVGGAYYLHRVLSRLTAVASQVGDAEREIWERFEDMVRHEILGRLVADRGDQAVAATLRRPQPEDLDLVTASRADLERIQELIKPLGRKLASRLAQRRRHLRRGHLDVRSTVRHSLSYGGALAEPQFKTPHVSKPDITLLCDLSGSVASFARFTLSLAYAIASEFTRVRAFAFIDSVDEVTGVFSPGIDLADSIRRILREADLVNADGHSDYGNVFATFEARYGLSLNHRTHLIITGDGRNNFRDVQAASLEALQRRVRSIHWLNPEPRRYWNTGDSVIAQYEPFTDGLHEVRTLRQLEEFIDRLATADAFHRRTVKV